MFRNFMILMAPVFVSAGAHAEPVFLDDRSTAASVVESLYNAVNRKEYGRAWDYFSEKPAATFEAFAKGYANTEGVTVVTGAVTSDGAAGTMFFEVPVAILAREGDEEQRFQGCYVVQQVNPAVQDPPYMPMMIKSAKLKKVEAAASLDDILPTSCDGTPAASLKDAVLARAKSELLKDLNRQCTLDFAGENRLERAEAHEIKYRFAYQAADEPDNSVVLLRFPCDSGAYNTIELYYIWQRDSGFEPLPFAMPDMAFEYVDEESAKLKSISLRGFASELRLINSEYDATTKSISMFSKWRGIGDASSTGTWVFREGRFVLDAYDVDPTYDGELEGIPVIKAGKPVALP